MPPTLLAAADLVGECSVGRLDQEFGTMAVSHRLVGSR